MIDGAVRCRVSSQRTVLRGAHLILVAPFTETDLELLSPVRIVHVEFQERFLDHPDFESWRDRFFALFDKTSFTKKGMNQIKWYRLSEQAAAELHTIFSRILNEYNGDGPERRPMIRLKFIEFLLTFMRAHPRLDAQQTKKGMTGIERAAGHITEHCADAFSLSLLADLCGLTPSYFSRLFREAMGAPVFEFINRVRIQKACGLLKRSELSVIEIALSVGYNNVSFFNRYFRKVMNMSPREYRNLAKK